MPAPHLPRRLYLPSSAALSSASSPSPAAFVGAAAASSSSAASTTANARLSLLARHFSSTPANGHTKNGEARKAMHAVNTKDKFQVEGSWTKIHPQGEREAQAGIADWDETTRDQLLPVQTVSHNSARVYYLNRPQKLNALNPEMVDLLTDSVNNWSGSKLAKIVIGRGRGGKAFCAGGDIKHIAELSSSESTRGEAMQFFKKEFELDWKLACYSVGAHTFDGSKTYIAVMDGLTMGGGAGLAFGAAVRVATEKTQFAMPETVIGYTPDVGSTHYLSQLDGYVGRYLALTGITVKGREVLDLGLATHYVPSHNIDTLVERLERIEDVDSQGGMDGLLSIIADYEVRYDPPTERARAGLDKWSADEPDSPTRLQGEIRSFLDQCFSKDTLPEILRELERLIVSDESVLTDESRDVARWAKETFDILKSRSPVSVAVTLEGMKRAELDIQEERRLLIRESAGHGKRYQKVRPNEALRRTFMTEYRAVEQFVHNVSPDFPSGVIRKLVHKLGPQWDTTVDPTARAKAFYPDPATTPLKASTPALELEDPTHGFDKYPFRLFGLPTEAELKAIITGAAVGSGDLAVTLGDVLARYDLRRPRVEDRIREILARKCKPGKMGTLTWVDREDKVKLRIHSREMNIEELEALRRAKEAKKAAVEGVEQDVVQQQIEADGSSKSV